MTRICYIGTFKGTPDEGMRNVGASISLTQSKKHEVLALSPVQVITKSRKLRKFRPEIIHYLSGPSFMSMLILRIAKFIGASKVTVVTASHPWTWGLVLASRIFRPDMIITQSSSQRKQFESIRSKIAFLPNGVDTRRFRHLSDTLREEMRAKLGVSNDKFVVLHVGNFRAGRNLIGLLDLAEIEGVMVLVVGSTSVKLSDRRVRNSLQKAGAIVIDKFLTDIERIYGCSDCYVFPTTERGRAIEIPLSVLEAMAANLPVISTKFGGLPDLFGGRDWVIFVDSPNEIAQEVLEMRGRIARNPNACNNRIVVEGMTWDAVCEQLDILYGRLLGAT